jgi:hypothetical protein
LHLLASIPHSCVLAPLQYFKLDSSTSAFIFSTTACLSVFSPARSGVIAAADTPFAVAARGGNHPLHLLVSILHSCVPDAAAIFQA